MDYNKFIEYTNLKSPNSNTIENMVKTADIHNYNSICIQPSDLLVANKARKKCSKNKELKLVTVAGFPPIRSFRLYENETKELQLYLGYYNSKTIKTIDNIISCGLSDELDLVFPIYWFATGKLAKIKCFLTAVKKRYKKPVKVICELGTIFNNNTALYEIYSILVDSGVDYFKTNTGLLKQDFDSLVLAIQRLNIMVNDFGLSKLKLKASGGVRTEEQVKKLIDIGVDKVGTSSKLNF